MISSFFIIECIFLNTSIIKASLCTKVLHLKLWHIINVKVLCFFYVSWDPWSLLTENGQTDG